MSWHKPENAGLTGFGAVRCLDYIKESLIRAVAAGTLSRRKLGDVAEQGLSGKSRSNTLGLRGVRVSNDG